MCLDFIGLSKLTITNKFPVLVIDYLLDELLGEKCFTKLDLCSRYHQIRMKDINIPKTTFRTHEVHYKFIEIPFSLYNAPSTFQSLMNKIFKPFIHNFLLVLLDDIMIYSKAWESHINNVDKCLKLLRDNQ